MREVAQSALFTSLFFIKIFILYPAHTAYISTSSHIRQIRSSVNPGLAMARSLTLHVSVVNLLFLLYCSKIIKRKEKKPERHRPSPDYFAQNCTVHSSISQ
ncbi:hypothetical protein HOY80DRAFT_374168 [Tuber brumale]|nr:hypothetical protein HOY80DRAFT_374168 [Tuber brumale]